MLCYYLRDTVEEKIKRDCETLAAETKARNEETIDSQDVESSMLLLKEMQGLVDRITKPNPEKEGSENG